MDCFTVIYGFWWGTASNSIVYIPVDSYRWLGRTEDRWHQAACEMDDALENQGHSCERKTVWSQWNCSENSSTLVSLMMLFWHILTSTNVFVQIKLIKAGSQIQDCVLCAWKCKTVQVSSGMCNLWCIVKPMMLLQIQEIQKPMMLLQTDVMAFTVVWYTSKIFKQTNPPTQSDLMASTPR